MYDDVIVHLGETRRGDGKRKGLFQERDAVSAEIAVQQRDIRQIRMGITATLYSNVASESISKAIGAHDEQSALDAIPHLADILENSILMGVERVQHTDKKGAVLLAYRLYNLYWYQHETQKAPNETQKEPNEPTKTPNILACTIMQNTVGADAYEFQSIENVPIDQSLPSDKADMSQSVDEDTCRASQLYRVAKRIDRENGGLIAGLQ